MHYLDNAATTPVLPKAADLAHDILNNCWANPAQGYKIGIEASDKIAEARSDIAQILGCEKEEIYFTASGSEGNNLALWGAVLPRLAWADNIVCTGYEHPSVFNAMQKIAERHSLKLTIIQPAINGQVDIEAFAAAVNKKTALATAMHANNETGAVIDVAKLAELVKEKNSRCAFHSDGVQSFCKLPLNIKASKIDSYAVSGHKICAPKGIGALYVRKGFNFDALMQGGGQENNKRPGTENTAFIAAMALAAKQMAIKDEITPELHERLLNGLKNINGIKINSPNGSIHGIINILLPQVYGETMMNYLAQTEVYVSTGSACSGKSPSHTLSAMGFTDKQAQMALRISFNRFNTSADIDTLLSGLKEGLAALQKIPE